jgi:hypothetical protein
MSFTARAPGRARHVDHDKLRAIERAADVAQAGLRGLRSQAAEVAEHRQSLRVHLLDNLRGRYALAAKDIDLDPHAPWQALRGLPETELSALGFNPEDVQSGCDIDSDLTTLQAQIQGASIRVSQQMRVVLQLRQYANFGSA